MANNIRKDILEKARKSSRNFPYAEHPDLISFLVSSECFKDTEDMSEYPDFDELLVVVDKVWLFRKMKDDYTELISDNDCRAYLQNEYTSDDSYYWFNAALEDDAVLSVWFE